MTAEYTTRHNPRARRLILRLDKTGQPVVTVPRFMPNWFVKRFVAAHQAWITKAQRQLRQTQAEVINDDSLTLFGKQYRQVTKPTTDASRVSIKANQLIIAHHTGKTKQQILDQFLKNTATHYIGPRTHQLAKQMGVSFRKITLRAQATRWGSASSTGNLNFNWKLVHFTPKIIDSVIIHELAHLRHHNHSRDFWRFVEQFDPDYRLHRGWLKRQGIGVV
jgi:hypothetical protein